MLSVRAFHNNSTSTQPLHITSNHTHSFDDDDDGAGARAGGGYTFHLRAFGLRWRAAVLEAAGRVVAQVLFFSESMD